MRKIMTLCLLTGLAGGLGGCVQSQAHLSPDFGVATRQALAAQIADPDARYRGDPAPGADGRRAALAQERYGTGTVLPPAAAASTITAGGVGQGGAPPK